MRTPMAVSVSVWSTLEAPPRIPSTATSEVMRVVRVVVVVDVVVT